MHKASALWHLSAQQSVLQEVALKPNPQQNCLIRSLYSLISTGTEKLVSTGKVPNPLYDHMQVPYMEGSFAFPIKYGYSLVGRVEQGPSSLVSKVVHLLHPHQDFCYVQADDLFVVPDTIPPARATLASNLETALNAIWDSQVSMGDKVLVVGFGIIGSLIARLLQNIPAVQVEVQDTAPPRQQLVKQLGLTLADPDDQRYDMAFHTSGSSEGLQTCLDQVGFEGKVVELSWYGIQPINIRLGSTFHSERKQIISSQVSHLPPDRRARWDFKRRKRIVFDLLKDPAFDEHITQVIPFQQLPQLFDQIRKGNISELCWGVKY